MSFGTAFAQAAAAPKSPSLIEMLFMPAIIFFVFYFLIIRPQARRAKEHTKLLETLKAGDEIVTSGGLIGKIRSISPEFVSVELAANVSVKVLKQHIASLTK